MPDNGDSHSLPHEEPMRYAMLGRDDSTLADKLEKYSGEADWEILKPHLESGALIYVDPMLDLTQVGRAFAEDDQDQVHAWLKNGDLVRPSAPHGSYWQSMKATFICQVVSPFILIQPTDPGKR